MRNSSPAFPFAAIPDSFPPFHSPLGPELLEEVDTLSHTRPGLLWQLEGTGWLGPQRGGPVVRRAGRRPQLVRACLELRVQRRARSGSLCGITAAPFFPSQLIPFPQLTLLPPFLGPATCGARDMQDLPASRPLMLTPPPAALPPESI